MTHEPFDEVLDLDSQIIDALHGSGIVTIKDLCALTGKELGRLRGIGPQRLKWLIYEMTRRGLAPVSLPRFRWNIVTTPDPSLLGWGPVSPWYDTADNSALSLYAIRLECGACEFSVVKRPSPLGYSVWRPNPLPTDCTLEEAYEEVRTKLLEKHGVDLRTLTLANLVDLWKIPGA